MAVVYKTNYQDPKVKGIAINPLGITGESPQHSEDLERIARPEGQRKIFLIKIQLRK